MVYGLTDQEDIMTQTLPSPPNIDGEWPEQGTWTYGDYTRLPDDGRRYEVIKEVLYMAQEVIEVFTLQNDNYMTAGRYTAGQSAVSEALDGFSISVDTVCAG